MTFQDESAGFACRRQEPDRVPLTAYILMEYPRVSETFISNEMLRLEQLGVELCVFSIKQPKDTKVHATVGQIKAPVTYLPPVSSLSATPFMKWLCHNVPPFLIHHTRVFMARPWKYLCTLAEALALCFWVKPHSFRKPKKVFFKEFLQAGFIAKEILCNRRITHLHAHFCHGATTIALFVSRILGLSFSFTAHAKDIYLPTLNPGNLLVRKIQRAKFVVTCTNANRLYLESLTPQPSRIYTVYHGLDPHLFIPNPDPKGPVPLILSVGRFVAKKGFEYLVEACGILRDRGHAFRCQIIGDPGDEVAGDQTPMIQQRIQEKDLEEWVTLSPSVTQETLQTIYRQATIFALPCQIVENGDRDGIPNVIAEAMATGLPVVATAISGIPELISDRINGILVPAKNPQALADALEELLSDASLRETLGQAARTTICHVFDSHHTTRTLQRLFLENQEEPLGIREHANEIASCH